MRTALLIVTLALALGPSHIDAADAAGAAKKVGVFSMFPFAYKGADGKLTGFDVAVATKACELAGIQCEMVEIATLAERIPKLLDNSVHILFATLTKTDERAKQVLFVAPNYYSAGSSLFALEDKAAAASEWSGLKDKKVCSLASFYLNDALKSKWGVELVEAADTAGLVDKLVAGDCIAAVSDSTDLGLIKLGKDKGATIVATDAPAQDVAPYAAAVRPADQELAVKLSGALAQGMLSAGNSSAIFSVESEYVLGNGGEPAPFLADLADAISYMVPRA